MVSLNSLQDQQQPINQQKGNKIMPAIPNPKDKGVVEFGWTNQLGMPKQHYWYGRETGLVAFSLCGLATDKALEILPTGTLVCHICASLAPYQPTDKV